MNILLVPIPCPPDQSFASIRFEGPKFLCPYHRHPELELVSIETSTGRMVAGDYSGSFHDGDIFLLGENIPHIFQNSPLGPHQIARSHVIQFRADFAGELLFGIPELAEIGRLLHASRRGLRIVGSAREPIRRQMLAVHEARGVHRMIALLELLATLSQPRTCKPLATASYDPMHAPCDARMETIISYLQERFTQPILVPDVARKAGLTPNAFCRYFRKVTRTTFTAYVNDLRIKEACRLLQETEAPVTEIGFSCGFGNLAHFHNEFRGRMKTSPGKYRQSLRALQSQ